jgi:hypothetical protein
MQMLNPPAAATHSAAVMKKAALAIFGLFLVVVFLSLWTQHQPDDFF